MIQSFCEKLRFPDEAALVFAGAEKILRGNARWAALARVAEESLFTPGDRSFGEITKTLASETGLHPYTVDMTVLLMALEPLREAYRRANLSEALLWETMEDLTCKLWECKNVYGVWGNFVAWWYPWFYQLKRFKLGRLEFEEIPLPVDYRGWKQGDTVINCHIPSCGPLAPEEVTQSLKRAWKFYESRQRDGVLLVVCKSWLLYPPHFPVYPAGGNLRKFTGLFDVRTQNPQENNGDFWRIFNMPYTWSALKTAPADTALRKNFLEYLRRGASMGEGFGCLRFDGERVL